MLSIHPYPSFTLPSLFLFLPSPTPFLFFPAFPQKQGQTVWEHCKLPLWSSGQSPTENEFGALQTCQKATGGNHFEYSEVYVLQQINQNLAESNMIQSAKLDQTSAERCVDTTSPPAYALVNCTTVIIILTTIEWCIIGSTNSASYHYFQATKFKLK